MPSTYESITRAQFEDWATRVAGPGKWRLKPGRGGVYQFLLSPTVMIEINSTTGNQDSVRSRGQASMSMRLTSRVTGKTLNRKAMGQKYFARTTNWRKNWAKGVNRMVDAYEKSKGFYDSIARIEDRDQYLEGWIAKIEGVDGWNTNDFIVDMHTRLSGGGVLTVRQEVALESALQRGASRQQGGHPPVFLDALREIYRRARHRGDQRTVRFIGSVGQQASGRRLSENQMKIVREIADAYMVELPV
jgi:hypothetical protein